MIPSSIYYVKNDPLNTPEVFCCLGGHNTSGNIRRKHPLSSNIAGKGDLQRVILGAKFDNVGQ